jgi:hypothetical protein
VSSESLAQSLDAALFCKFSTACSPAGRIRGRADTNRRPAFQLVYRFWRGKSTLVITPVAVDKPISAKIAKMKSRQDAISAIFSDHKTFSIPQNLTVWSGNRVFQQQRLISS